MQSASPCSICKEGGHRESKCPELRAPLREGFQGGGGGGGGGHDHDEEERCKVVVVAPCIGGPKHPSAVIP